MILYSQLYQHDALDAEINCTGRLICRSLKLVHRDTLELLIAIIRIIYQSVYDTLIEKDSELSLFPSYAYFAS